MLLRLFVLVRARRIFGSKVDAEDAIILIGLVLLGQDNLLESSWLCLLESVELKLLGVYVDVTTALKCILRSAHRCEHCAIQTNRAFDSIALSSLVLVVEEDTFGRFVAEEHLVGAAGLNFVRFRMLLHDENAFVHAVEELNVLHVGELEFCVQLHDVDDDNGEEENEDGEDEQDDDLDDE